MTVAPLRVLMVTSEWPTVDSPAEGAFIEQQARFLRLAGVDVELFHFSGRHRALGYLRIWKRLGRTIKHGDFDLVHAQFGHSGALASTPKRLPVVVTYRGSDLLGGDPPGLGWLFKAVSRYGARRADARIVVAEHLSSHLPKPPSAVIPSGIDVSLFRPIRKDIARHQLRLPHDQPLVLFVENRAGRREKRLWLAQQATDLVKGARLLHVYGIDRSAMPAYMNAADLLLLVSSQEGSPNVVKEALACGLPVVSVDVGDVRERIGPIEGCITCRDDRPETITDAINEVLARNQRIDAGAGMDDLDERVLTEKVISVYREVLDGRRTRAAAIVGIGSSR